MSRAAAPALPLLALLASGCSIAPPPPSPDPIAAAPGTGRREGVVAAAGSSEAGFCVSQQVTPSLVLLVPDGVAVRPLADAAPADYALVLRPSEAGGVAASRLVAASDPVAMAAVAERLDQALAACVPVVPAP